MHKLQKYMPKPQTQGRSRGVQRGAPLWSNFDPEFNNFNNYVGRK